MTAFTRLERAVMAALAQDLRSQLPDLAGQFAASTPSVRRNTGFGLFTETVVDRNRPAPVSGPTGEFGAVHAMVGKLHDPIAFKVRVRNGVLLGLNGDSYGQDTRSIDFATVSFDQVFTVDENGASIPFDDEPIRAEAPAPRYTPRPAPAAPSSRPALPSSKPAPVRSSPPPAKADARPPKDDLGATGPLVDLIRAGQSPAAREAVIDVFNPDGAAPLPDMTADEKKSLIFGLWIAMFAAVVIAVLAFEAPLTVSVILAAVVGRWLQRPEGLALIRRGLKAWKTVRAASAG
ncbi:hypothetical protein [Brevundimonas lenta]|uniref:Uncharacterized protein n=1 Tax=Brevundimonas lenta TaxID=424796 RepID=A0A7W6JF04_9CAUL|nr:hypothetical protein [Brevundimonas lenta]MBB4083889.1 hypothetical protein [Brevundimonas lenta]